MTAGNERASPEVWSHRWSATPPLPCANRSKNTRAYSPPAQPAIVLKQHSKRACTKQLHVRIKSSWPLLEHWARDHHMASHCHQRQPTKSSKTNVKVEHTWQFAALHKETNRRKAMCPQRCAYKVIVARYCFQTTARVQHNCEKQTTTGCATLSFFPK